MQKTYTKDFRTHKSVKNVDLNKYFKEGHHDAIIRKKDWQKVQDILSLRRASKKPATMRQLGSRFIVSRIKNGLFQGYFVLDARWSVDEKKEFIQMIETPKIIENERN